MSHSSLAEFNILLWICEYVFDSHPARILETLEWNMNINNKNNNNQRSAKWKKANIEMLRMRCSDFGEWKNA